jgi:hypothetical protein
MGNTMANTFKVKLQYFKQSGKFYEEGEYESRLVAPHQIFDEVRELKAKCQLPNISGNEFNIYVDIVDAYPGLIIHEW